MSRPHWLATYYAVGRHTAVLDSDATVRGRGPTRVEALDGLQERLDTMAEELRAYRRERYGRA